MNKALSLVLVLIMVMGLSIPAFAEGVTLNAIFMKQAGYSEDDVLAMTQAFTESTGIQVNPTFVAYEELAPKILTSAASGGYDVILGDCIWPAQFAKAGLVLDVTDRVSALDLDDIYQGALDATKYEGKYYGMPWLNDVKYMFVNMELLKQVGVEEAPTTWDQLIEDAKLCKEQGVCEYPIVGCYAQAECLICDYTCIAGAFGGAFVDEHCQTGVPGIFAAGNVLHVHDLVDFVSLEAEALADSAAEYLLEGSLPACPLEVKAGNNVGHVIPQHISGTRDFTLSLRVRQPLKDVSVVVRQGDREVLRKKMRKALPAEMIQLPIQAAKLTDSADMEVCVE